MVRTLQIGSLLLLGISQAANARVDWRAVVGNYCLECHDADAKKGGLDLEAILEANVSEHSATWEGVVRQLHARQMPPVGKDRPDELIYNATASALEELLDQAAAEKPNPGRTETLRRLNRTEYRNAISDLLGVDIDVSTMLPPDEASHGFDNVTVSDLTPVLLNRYISAAEKISRVAVGGEGRAPDSRTVRIRPDVTQEEHVDGLPLGTRGGALIPHRFPVDGDYDVRIHLMRDRNEEVEGLRGKHQLEVLIDGAPVTGFEVVPPKNRKDHTKIDAHLSARISVKKGNRALGVTFVKLPTTLEETLRQPYDAHFNRHRHPRRAPGIYQVTISGPYDAKKPDASASFPEEKRAADAQFLRGVMRRAYRRPITDADLERPMVFYDDDGLAAALSAVLVSREFLFRVERDPENTAAKTAYAVNDLDLASRLSFFLWSSVPDDELIDVAARGELSGAAELARQVQRMLQDDRSLRLVTNFADQWLYLRNLDSATPNGRLFPGFDDNLRQAFRRETELLFETILREDRSVLDLIDPGFTFLNERLAKHYDVPHIYGSRFRRVALESGSARGGLLRHGSILTVTSYATRTSPVIRGQWVLENLLGTPPPPPPPDVPSLDENSVSASLPIRERLAAHRRDPACAHCHNIIDPVGFSLEHYDAVGRWRDTFAGNPVDASGGFADGSTFVGVAGLEAAIVGRPDLFARTLSEKLLTFALGRGVEPSDAPAIREIVRSAKSDDYKFSAVIQGIVSSAPFRMRTSE